jgi:hypothetical protein
MVELKDIFVYTLIIVISMIILGVGAIILTNTGQAGTDISDTLNESFVYPLPGSSVNLFHNNLTRFTKVLNSTNTEMTNSRYSVDLEKGVFMAVN